jgi:opacity protein-like surface antigen
MGFRFGTICGLAATIAASSPAWADSPFYVSGDLGKIFRESDRETTHFSSSAAPNMKVPGTNGFTYDSGITGNLAAGYRLNSRLRVEAEFGYATYLGSTVHPLTSDEDLTFLNGKTFQRASGARYSAFSGELNTFYDFQPLLDLFTPFVGGGVGGSADHRSLGHYVAFDKTRFQSSSGSSLDGFAMLEGGVTVDLTKNISLAPAYRYVRYFTGSADGAHVAMVNLRYKF